MAVAYLHNTSPAARLGLRARAPGDCAELFELFNEPSFLEHALMREPFVDADDLGRWMDALSSVRRFELVATSEGRCIGFGAVYVQGEHFAHCGMMVLGVREAYRRGGAGALLVRALVATARNVAKLGKLQLTVITDNAAAIRLYRKHGFQFEGLHRRFARRGERYLDAYSMAILLDEPESPSAALSA